MKTRKIAKLTDPEIKSFDVVFVLLLRCQNEPWRSRIQLFPNLLLLIHPEIYSKCWSVAMLLSLRLTLLTSLESFKIVQYSLVTQYSRLTSFAMAERAELWNSLPSSNGCCKLNGSHQMTLLAVAHSWTRHHGEMESGGKTCLTRLGEHLALVILWSWANESEWVKFSLNLKWLVFWIAKLLCNTWAIGGIDPAEQVQMPWVDKDTSLPWGQSAWRTTFRT